jgi:hypothetical protein
MNRIRKLLLGSLAAALLLTGCGSQAGGEDTPEDGGGTIETPEAPQDPGEGTGEQPAEEDGCANFVHEAAVFDPETSGGLSRIDGWTPGAQGLTADGANLEVSGIEYCVHDSLKDFFCEKLVTVEYLFRIDNLSELNTDEIHIAVWAVDTAGRALEIDSYEPYAAQFSLKHLLAGDHYYAHGSLTLYARPEDVAGICVDYAHNDSSDEGKFTQWGFPDDPQYSTVANTVIRYTGDTTAAVSFDASCSLDSGDQTLMPFVVARDSSGAFIAAVDLDPVRVNAGETRHVETTVDFKEGFADPGLFDYSAVNADATYELLYHV